MQVYASITPVVHLVNVGSESGGVKSLANVTVRFSVGTIARNYMCFRTDLTPLRRSALVWMTCSLFLAY